MARALIDGVAALDDGGQEQGDEPAAAVPRQD
jgi:hypothetical protein